MPEHFGHSSPRVSHPFFDDEIMNGFEDFNLQAFEDEYFDILDGNTYGFTDNGLVTTFDDDNYIEDFMNRFTNINEL